MSETLRERFKRLEADKGFEARPYKCSTGHWTIGFGWNLDANPLPAHIKEFFDRPGVNYITEEMAEELLTIYINVAIKDCHIIWPGFDSYSKNRQDALTDIIFNMGSGKVQKLFPAFVKAVRAQDWQRAADELKYSNGLTKSKLSGYWNQVHKRAEENYSLLVEVA